MQRLATFSACGLESELADRGAGAALFVDARHGLEHLNGRHRQSSDTSISGVMLSVGLTAPRLVTLDIRSSGKVQLASVRPRPLQRPGVFRTASHVLLGLRRGAGALAGAGLLLAAGLEGGDEFFDEDLPSARELAGSTPVAELFVYPGDAHLFTDSSLAAYDAAASALLLDRVQQFLTTV